MGRKVVPFLHFHFDIGLGKLFAHGGFDPLVLVEFADRIQHVQGQLSLNDRHCFTNNQDKKKRLRDEEATSPSEEGQLGRSNERKRKIENREAKTGKAWKNDDGGK